MRGHRLASSRRGIGAGRKKGSAASRSRAGKLKLGLPAAQPARTAPETWRQRTRLSARAQWRQNPRYQRIAAALSALDRSLLACVSERDREMLEWYYGLGGQDAEALDYRQIADKLNRTANQVSVRIHRVTAAMLGPDVVHARGDRNGTTRERCRTCRRIPAPTAPDPSGSFGWVLEP